MGASQRRKGHAFERWVARELRKLWPQARRGYQSRGGGAEASDVEGTPFHVECKRGKRPSPRAALEQAKADTDGRPVVCVIKDDRAEPFVVMRWGEWVELVKQAKGWWLDE